MHKLTNKTKKFRTIDKLSEKNKFTNEQAKVTIKDTINFTLTDFLQYFLKYNIAFKLFLKFISCI